LVGNKTDLESERVITTVEGTELANKLGIPSIETSAKTGAKTGDNILNAFETLIRVTPRSNMEYKVRNFQL